MNIKGIITQVQERKATNKAGQPVVYRDVFIGDSNTDPATRFPGELVLRPLDEEFQTHKMAEGVKLDLYIRQVLEVRNGLPVIRAYIRPLK